MTTFCSQRITKGIGNWFRDVVLVACVGILGSQFLLLVSGGFPLVQRAEASMGGGQYSSVAYRVDLDLSDPGQVRKIHITSTELQEKNLYIRIKHTEERVFSCYPSASENEWACPTQGVRVHELENVQAFSSSPD